MPLGNGRLGMMVYGGSQTETIALNEVTLWSGQEDHDANNLCGPENLKKMRQAFLDGDLAKGNELGNQYLSGHGKSFGTHLPFGDIKIHFLNRQGEVTRYHRSLNLNQAVASVSYDCGKVTYLQEYFASNPSQVAVIRLSANKRNRFLSLCRWRCCVIIKYPYQTNR